jgi:predicted ATP-grasp superfamily ATP-dependent carboligase
MITVMGEMMMTKILIIDGHDRRALAGVRSIGEKKEDFYIIIGSSRKLNASRFSKYCNEFVYYPDPDEDEEDFVDFLIEYIKANQIQVLVPMGDRVAEIASKNKEKFKKVTHLLVPDYDVFMIARDKGITLEYAKKNNIPYPKTYKIEDIENDAEGITYPVIIKPRISSASMGIVIASNKEHAIECYKNVDAEYKEPIIQEIIPDVGEHYQANLLFDENSEIKASCIKKKIRQFPITGGPSTFFKTVDNKEIEEMSIRFLKNINWIGPAEVEYMIDPRDGTPKLMEINPRLSATIRLSCFVGVDFPYLIVQNALGNKTELVKNNKYEYFCQWFFPGDLLNFIFSKNKFNQEYGYVFKKPKNICHSVYKSNDIMPYIANVMALLVSAFNIKRVLKFVKPKN